jgi:hypothetical protein
LDPIADACPYRRPFPDGFDECPAYQPIAFVPIDLVGHELGSAWTCRQLAVGDATDGHFYARCRLGPEPARREWARTWGERAERLREVRRELVAAARPTMEAFLAAHRRSLGDLSRRPAMLAAAEAAIEALTGWVDAHPQAVEAAGLAPATARAILADMVRSWSRSRQPITSLEAPPDLIARYPDARDLLAPGDQR